MKIYTKLTIDMCTGEILEDEWYEYRGPVALCFTMGSSKSASSKDPDPFQKEVLETFFDETGALRREVIAGLLSMWTGQPYKPEVGERPVTGYDTRVIQPGDTAQYAALSKEIVTAEEDLARAGLDEKPYMARKRAEERLADLRTQLARVKSVEETIPIYGEYPEAGEPGFLPIIQQLVESSRKATSATMKGTREDLARSNLVGTPFGQQILAKTLQQGETTTAGVPYQAMQPFLQMLPGFVTGQGQTIVSGLGDLGTERSKAFSWNIGVGGD